VPGGDDTMWSCSLGRRSPRDGLDPSVSRDQRQGRWCQHRLGAAYSVQDIWTQRSLRYRETRSNAQRSVVPNFGTTWSVCSGTRRGVSLRNISGASLTRLIVPCADPTEPVADCHGIPAMSRQRRLRCGRRRKHRAAVDAVRFCGEWSRGWTRSGGNPQLGCPGAQAQWADCRQEEPQTLVEYSRAMTPEEVAAMTPREREYGVVAFESASCGGVRTTKANRHLTQGARRS
jgi:hypothetical protein